MSRLTKRSDKSLDRMNTPSCQSFSSVLVRALLAYSVYEHKYEGGTATSVRLAVQPRRCTLQDNGRGIGLHRDGYVSGLVEQLAVRRTDVALHGLGLALIAMSSPSMTIQSRRGGHKYSQQFEWGIAKGVVEVEPWDGPTGTEISLTLGDSAPEIDFEEVMVQAEFWRSAHPELHIEVVRGE
jgi:DNA gyrase/topoisomerase IV subunit B